MRRRNRDINIFNMSALDLFASALGAFILLFVILMPYYLKTSKTVMQENAKLQTENRSCKAEVEEFSQQLEECEQQRDKLKAENESLKQKLSQAEKAQKAAESELENKVRFALLGINTKAESFVIVVDMSGSMKAYNDIMINTVARILEPFENKHRVQIFGYQEASFSAWQNPYQLAGMSDANKQLANSFAKSLGNKFDGGTPTRKALLEALNYDAEAIILLTDGAPDNDPGEIIRTVTAQNSGTKEIHTVAIGEYNVKPALVAFLQQLAKQNRGAFVGVAQ